MFPIPCFPLPGSLGAAGPVWGGPTANREFTLNEFRFI